MDNDQLHMTRHMRDLQLAEQDKYGDKDAILALKAHYVDHIHQLETKALVQAIAEQAVQQAQAMGTNPAASLGLPGGGAGLPPGVMMPPGGTDLAPSPVPMAGSVAPPIPKKQFKRKPPALRPVQAA